MDVASESLEEFSRERLMDDVRQYPCLYDKYCKDYQDKNLKNNAWAALAAKYGVTATDAEKKYKTIRSSYTRYLKRKRNAPPGTRNADGPTPIAFQNLDWLASHIDHKETSARLTPFAKTEGYLSEYDGEEDMYRGSYGEMVRDGTQMNGVSEVPLSNVGIDRELVHSDRVQSQGEASISDSAGPTTERSITMYYEKPKNIEEKGETTVSLKPFDSFQQPFVGAALKRKRDHDEEDELFCLSLAANLKRLTPRNKAIAKMRFQQALFDLEFPSDQSEQQP